MKTELPNQRGFIAVLVILLLIAAAAITAFLLLSKPPTKVATPKQELVNVPIPTPTPLSPWKIYQGEGFSVEYPRFGVIVQEDAYIEGECGSQIRLDPKDQSALLIDNFFKIKTVSWEKTLEDYLIAMGAKNAYEIEALEGSGVDEAVRLLRLKEGFEIAVGYPPLAFTKTVFRKGEKVYLLQGFNTITNFGGCILPQIADPVKYPEISKQSWDFAASVKF